MAERIVTEQHSDSVFFGYDTDPNDPEQQRRWGWQCNATYSRDCYFFRALPDITYDSDVAIESSEWKEAERQHTEWHLSRVPVILFWEGENT